MSAMTDYLEKKLVDHSLGKAAYTMPTTVYLALHKSNPTETGSVANEVTGGAYARQAITTIMSAAGATTGQSANGSLVAFPIASADWGMITHCAIMDAPTGGNMLYQAPAVIVREILAGDVYQVPIGSITVTLS